jgi:hypothetical protein
MFGIFSSQAAHWSPEAWTMNEFILFLSTFFWKCCYYGPWCPRLFHGRDRLADPQQHIGSTSTGGFQQSGTEAQTEIREEMVHNLTRRTWIQEEQTKQGTLQIRPEHFTDYVRYSASTCFTLFLYRYTNLVFFQNTDHFFFHFPAMSQSSRKNNAGSGSHADAQKTSRSAGKTCKVIWCCALLFLLLTLSLWNHRKYFTIASI